jgi:TolA-binding protein
MKRIVIIGLFLGVLNAEPSAFEAGNLESSNPYGLTKNEKYIWQNKQDIKKLKKLINLQAKLLKEQKVQNNKLKLRLLNQKMKIQTLSQKMEEIVSVFPMIDNINVELKNLKKELNQTNLLKVDILALQENVKVNSENDKNNTKMIVSLVEKLAFKIDSLEQKVKKLNSYQNDFRHLSKSKIFEKALYNFKYQRYVKSKQMFSYLYNLNYKPATSLFYLGEINYKQSHYNEALKFYKKSVKTYSKPTSFTAELLYHTAYSFEKINNPEMAKKSYYKIIEDFPNSIFVKYAKKRVQNLEKNK